MTKFWLDFDQKIFTPTNLDIGTLPKFITHTNINFTPQKYALLLYKIKTSGTEVRRTQDVRIRFVGFIRFVSFNFGNVQLLRFVCPGHGSVIFIRSS